jgi:hypothetical protein
VQARAPSTTASEDATALGEAAWVKAPAVFTTPIRQVGDRRYRPKFVADDRSPFHGLSFWHFGNRSLVSTKSNGAQAGELRKTSRKQTPSRLRW